MRILDDVPTHLMITEDLRPRKFLLLFTLTAQAQAQALYTGHAGLGPTGVGPLVCRLNTGLEEGDGYKLSIVGQLYVQSFPRQHVPQLSVGLLVLHRVPHAHQQRLLRP